MVLIDLDFNFLRNRIEGLPNTAVDRLINKSSKRLYEIMRGVSVTRSDEVYINSEFKVEQFYIPPRNRKFEKKVNSISFFCVIGILLVLIGVRVFLI